MTATPLVPMITLEVPQFKSLTICSCCGVQSDTVKHLRFNWRDAAAPKMYGGGTTVALCLDCRNLTKEALS